jgi:hypothetical protein
MYGRNRSDGYWEVLLTLDSSPICHSEWQRSWREEPYDRVRYDAVNGVFRGLGCLMVLSVALELRTRTVPRAGFAPLTMTLGAQKKNSCLRDSTMSVKMRATPMRSPEFF